MTSRLRLLQLASRSLAVRLRSSPLSAMWLRRLTQAMLFARRSTTPVTNWPSSRKSVLATRTKSAAPRTSMLSRLGRTLTLTTASRLSTTTSTKPRSVQLTFQGRLMLVSLSSAALPRLTKPLPQTFSAPVMSLLATMKRLASKAVASTLR